MNQLSFEPKFHRHISEGQMQGWTLISSPLVNPMQFFNEIVDEQKRIESEGGAILVLDPKC